MKKLLLLLTVTMASACAAASVFDTRSALTLAEQKKHYNKIRARENNSGSTLYYPTLLRFNPDGGLEYINSIGGVVFYTRADMALCCIPQDNVELLDNSRYINNAELMRTAACSLDKSRSFSGVDAVHNGSAPDIPGYDGSGVVTGFCDVGFDPGHVAFKGRVPMMVTYRDFNAIRSVYAPGTTFDNGGDLKCERNDELHATHVANIMAGGYKGNAFYGAAPGAEIVATVSETSTMALLCGIEDVIAYARLQNKPAVVNLSMSSHTGPHDGTDLTNRYLDLLGQEAIIVFSSGNSGNSRQSLSHTFTADKPTVTSFFDAISWTGFNILGNADIWSADSRPLELQLVVCEKQNHTIVHRSEWINPAEAATAAGTMMIDMSDDGWNKYFPADNYVNLAWGVNSENNRFCYSMSLNINPTECVPGQQFSLYSLGFIVRGAAGTEMDIYTGSGLALMDFIPGSVHGNADASINNMCCNSNTISIGSWNTRNTIPLLGGGEHTFNFGTETHTAFSSYATLRDGRKLPDICAPGNYVISALSTMCIENTDIEPYPWTSFYETIDSRKHYWGGQCGTSMAAPMAAGVFALWLQANPTLNVHEIRDIAQASARRDFADISDPHWGAAGALDAAAGLRMAIDRAGIENVANPLVISVNPDHSISVTLGSQPVPFSAYNMQGRVTDAARPLPRGVYIIVSQGYTQKIKI